MPKNPGLEYQATEPAFLRRMKAGQTALDGRHDVQIPRARGGVGRNQRLKMDGDEGEDNPVMLDESGNVVSKEDMEAMATNTSGLVSKDGLLSNVLESQDVQEAKKRQKPQDTGVISGLGRKRKIAKVVGEEEKQESESPEELKPTKSLKQSSKDLQNIVEMNKEVTKKDAANGTYMKKEKRKKIKLSFDEPDST